MKNILGNTEFGWEEPNTSLQLKTLAINLANMFGDTELEQTFYVLGNKKCRIRIEIEENDD